MAGAAAALREAMAAPFSPIWQTYYQSRLAPARQPLGDAARAAWLEGHRMPLPQAITSAVGSGWGNPRQSPPGMPPPAQPGFEDL